MTLDKKRFILENTSVQTPPHVPEVRLHLADEAHDLWHRTEDELAQTGLPPPFWAFAWAGGQGLARHVLDSPALVRGKRVIDFASGSGLVGIAAKLAGAASVTCNDIDPFASEAASLNMAINGVLLTTDPADMTGSDVRADVLLAGDVFYDRALAEKLTPWFDKLAGLGVTVLIGDPGRAYLPKSRLEALAEYQVPVTRALEDAEVKRAIVWRFCAEPNFFPA
jgi:predicted nicotinamide N-methyase